MSATKVEHAGLATGNILREAVIPTGRLMPSWLEAVAEWNPLSVTASSVRELLSGTELAGVTFVADHVVLFAIGWPLALTAAFVPLATRA